MLGARFLRFGTRTHIGASIVVVHISIRSNDGSGTPDICAEWRTLLQKVHDRRFSVSWIRRRISIYLPRVPSGLPSVLRHPFCDRVMRLVQAIVPAVVDDDGSLSPWCLGRVHLARSFECAGDLDTEVAQYRRAELRWVVIDKNVMAVSPQTRLAAKKLPDLAQSWSPRRADRSWSNLTPHRSQFARVNALYVDRDGHSSRIVNQPCESGEAIYRLFNESLSKAPKSPSASPLLGDTGPVLRHQRMIGG